MKHIAIDLETTGLNPERDEIIQIAAIAETDFLAPVEDLPRIDIWIQPGWNGLRRLAKNPLALDMHKGLLARMGVESHDPFFCGDDAQFEGIQVLLSWISKQTGGEKAVISGKNFSGFDMRFLRAKAPDVEWHKHFWHRTLDPGSMFYGGEDVPPSLAQIAEREGIDYKAHDALGDCEAVIRAIRLFVGRAGV